MNRDTAAVSSSAEMEDNDENPELCAKEKLILKTFVQEYKFLHRLVDGIVKNGGIVDLAAVKKAQSILDKYQEQGQLLEPHLESLVSPLMNLVRSKTVDLGIGCESERIVVKIIQPICMFLYTLVTVCGYKIVARFFPHQVSDLEPAVMLLEKCHARTSVASSHIRQESTGEWETKCIILLWLSILVLVPFDISSVDTAMAGNVSADDGVATSPLVERMISICKDFLSNPGPMRKMAGVLLSKLLTRPDMKHNLTRIVSLVEITSKDAGWMRVYATSFVPRFMEWTENSLAASEDGFANNFLVAGITEATAAIFKAGGRDTLLDVVSIAWKETCTLLKSTFAAHSPLICKLLIKLTQRIGLTYLPQRLPTWRYVGKSSFLKENLSSQVPTRNSDNGATQELKSPCALKIEDSQDTEMEVPSVIEEIIEQLLSGLRDKDTVVRWSAAKGIGRVTSCLTTGFADDVISSILDLFSPGEGDGSWHGGCLALAELARRGLLLPNRLPDVVPVIIKALHYDVRRGPHSVGSHVRDAASYVCWAFGRAYSHPVMKSVLNDIAPHLLAVACYDREVNCRRAAAAAVQENVGRQGAFPHGIDIINAADYFTLASRNNSYQHVAVHIARFNNYLPVFIEELVERKINHWDKGIKELAAISLASLVKYDVIYFGDTVLSKLIPCTLSLDLNMRHGATLAVAEVVLALHQNGYVFTTENSRAVGGIVPAIEKARLYRGKGGEIMRASVSKLIECTSIAHIHLSAKVQNKLLETINENLRHPNAQIQACAARALCQFVRAYVDSRDMVTVNGFSSKYVQILRTDPNVAAKRGAALALSVLPYQFLIEDWKSILEGLSDACVVPENPNERDAETRVNAVRGLLAVCQTLTGVGMESNTPITYRKEPLLGFIKKNVIHMLFKALDDYSVDNRGDVGSWVREAAMEALEKCTDILCQGFYMFAEDASIIANLSYTNKHFLDCVEKEEDIFDQELAAKVTALIAKQAVEKIDKVRDVAGKTLQRIIHNNNVVIPLIPHRDQLERIVPKERSMNWAVPSVSFPRLVKLLQYEEYRMPLLSGLVVSTGGLSESLSKASLSALIDFLHVPKSKVDIHKKRVKVLASTLTEVLHRYQKVNRVIIPSIKTIELLFDKGVFMQLEEEQKEMFSIAILESLAVELKGSKDVTKLITGINVLESVSALKASNRNKIFSFLLSFLGHPYPKVRKSCADRVYLYLIQNGELFGTEVLNKALELIGETCWDGIREEAITQMKEIYSTFNLEAPSVRTVPQRSDKVLSESKFNKKDENESYSALVDSSGF